MTTRERKKTESPSDLTASRMDALESKIDKLASMIETVATKQNEVPKMPTTISPEARINAVKEARLGGEATSQHRSVDLRHPGAEQKSFQPNDVVRIAETSSKYPAYQLDENNTPVKQIYEFHCQACANIETYSSGPAKKICQKCSNTMLKTATGRYEPGTPALGVVMNFMYKARHGGNKYKVHFEKFGTDGLSEQELVLCQR